MDFSQIHHQSLNQNLNKKKPFNTNVLYVGKKSEIKVSKQNINEDFRRRFKVTRLLPLLSPVLDSATIHLICCSLWFCAPCSLPLIVLICFAPLVSFSLSFLSFKPLSLHCPLYVFLCWNPKIVPPLPFALLYSLSFSLLSPTVSPNCAIFLFLLC